MPTYLSFVIIGSHSLVVIRILRLLRVFRILKLTRHPQAGRSLGNALWESREKISVFIFFVLTIVVMIMGYAIIAVPTGIVTTKMIKPSNSGNTQVYPHCLFDKHDNDAVFCKKCGGELDLK